MIMENRRIELLNLKDPKIIFAQLRSIRQAFMGLTELLQLCGEAQYPDSKHGIRKPRRKQDEDLRSNQKITKFLTKNLNTTKVTQSRYFREDNIEGSNAETGMESDDSFDELEEVLDVTEPSEMEEEVEEKPSSADSGRYYIEHTEWEGNDSSEDESPIHDIEVLSILESEDPNGDPLGLNSQQ